jgi:hypothetical protein
MIMPVAWTLQNQTVESLVNNQLERMWKEEVISIFLDGLKKIMTKLKNKITVLQPDT